MCIEAGYALDYHKKGRLLVLFQESEETADNPAFARPPFAGGLRWDYIGQASPPRRVPDHRQ